MRKVFSLLLALALVLSLAVPAFAATSGTLTVNGADSYKGADGKTYYNIKADVTPGSEYHQTDLFGDSFKNVMPGDKITAQIVINANFKLFNEDSIKVYLTGTPSNHIHAERDETVASNREFLQQLKLTVANAKTGDVYFSGTADKSFATDTPIGTFRSNGKITLDVTLEVPIEMDNDYANRVGEVDWTLKISAYDDPSVDNPKTGDYIMIAVAVMVVCAVALIVIFVAKRRKK